MIATTSALAILTFVFGPTVRLTGSDHDDGILQSPANSVAELRSYSETGLGVFPPIVAEWFDQSRVTETLRHKASNELSSLMPKGSTFGACSIRYHRCWPCGTRGSHAVEEP
jgi:hypothetical protein